MSEKRSYWDARSYCPCLLKKTKIQFPGFMVVKSFNTNSGEIRFDEKKNPTPDAQISLLLSAVSTSNIERIDVMQIVISRSVNGEDMSRLFADVLRGSAMCTNEQFKRMTHQYFALFCENSPDLALLCVHLLRKDCIDRSPIVRSSTLRLLCVPRLAELSQLLPESIYRCSMDGSGLVRRTAASACVRSNLGFKEEVIGINEILPHISRLLDSQEISVISATLQTVLALNAAHVSDLLHDKYRMIVSILSSLDDAGKVAALELLGLYARLNFAGPDSQSDDFCGLIQAVDLELTHTNSAAVLAAALKTRIGLTSTLPTAAIARILSTWGFSEEVCVSFLRALRPYSRSLKPIVRCFYIFASESADVQLEKLIILEALVDEDNCSDLLRELQTYLRMQSKTFIPANLISRLSSISDKFSGYSCNAYSRNVPAAVTASYAGSICSSGC